LVELMVSAAILGIVMVALVQTFTTTQKTHISVEQVTVTQQNLRLIADLIERDIRVAGYLVPKHAAVCGVDSTIRPDSLYVSDADVLLSIAQLETLNPSAMGGNLGASIPGIGPGATIGGATTDITVSERWLDIVGIDDFGVGRGVIVVDRNDLNGRSTCGTITQFVPNAGNGATIRVAFESPAITFPPNAPPDVVAIPAHVYSINVPVPGSGMPYQLIRDGALVANDVEDLQLGLFFDFDDDGIIDAGEFMGDDGSVVGDATPVQYSADVNDGSTLRQLRISIITATERDDTGTDSFLGQQQTTGNRNPASLDAADRKKRRVYTSTIRLRNV
jgi:type II secretory pathway pseudopilin PulG